VPVIAAANTGPVSMGTSAKSVTRRSPRKFAV